MPWRSPAPLRSEELAGTQWPKAVRWLTTCDGVDTIPVAVELRGRLSTMVRGTKIYALVRDLVLERGHAKCSPRVDFVLGIYDKFRGPETIYWTISAISDSVCVGQM